MGEKVGVASLKTSKGSHGGPCAIVGSAIKTLAYIESYNKNDDIVVKEDIGKMLPVKSECELHMM